MLTWAISGFVVTNFKRSNVASISSERMATWRGHQSYFGLVLRYNTFCLPILKPFSARLIPVSVSRELAERTPIEREQQVPHLRFGDDKDEIHAPEDGHYYM